MQSKEREGWGEACHPVSVTTGQARHQAVASGDQKDSDYLQARANASTAG